MFHARVMSFTPLSRRAIGDSHQFTTSAIRRDNNVYWVYRLLCAILLPRTRYADRGIYAIRSAAIYGRDVTPTPRHEPILLSLNGLMKTIVICRDARRHLLRTAIERRRATRSRRRHPICTPLRITTVSRHDAASHYWYSHATDAPEPRRVICISQPTTRFSGAMFAIIYAVLPMFLRLPFGVSSRPFTYR